ncbi:MAG: class I SAM-dependent methyltransferase [Actinomycetota bacterium]
MATGADFDNNIDYLRDVQYRDSTELAKRTSLHATYGTAGQDAFSFFIDRMPWPEGGRVLDVGCGPGALWEQVASVGPDGIHLVVCDLSPGMVAEAVGRAQATGRFASVDGRVADAQSLPFDDGSFDAVVSTYALYHVPEPSRAVAEVARLVHDDGVVGIMTNGPGHLRELEAVRVSVFGLAGRYDVNRRFGPDRAAGMLMEVFGGVAWERFDDELHVTVVDDLMAYITSTPPANESSQAQVAELRRRLDDGVRDGVFVVSKHTGAFICRAPRRDGLTSDESN